eukprot:4065984-Pleurochrysis_carterae.AAC.1
MPMTCPINAHEMCKKAHEDKVARRTARGRAYNRLRRAEAPHHSTNIGSAAFLPPPPVPAHAPLVPLFPYPALPTSRLIVHSIRRSRDDACAVMLSPRHSYPIHREKEVGSIETSSFDSPS